MAEIPTESSVRSELPFLHPDVVIVLGIGSNIQLKGLHKKPAMENPRMRINTIATKELVVGGHLLQATVIIPIGKGTEVVKWHEYRLKHKKELTAQTTDVSQLRDLLPQKMSYLEFQDFMGQPSNEEELSNTAKVSQGELMTDLIRKARSKPAGDSEKNFAE